MQVKKEMMMKPSLLSLKINVKSLVEEEILSHFKRTKDYA